MSPGRFPLKLLVSTLAVVLLGNAGLVRAQTTVSDWASFKTALANENVKSITLAANLTATETLTVARNLTISGNVTIDGGGSFAGPYLEFTNPTGVDEQVILSGVSFTGATGGAVKVSGAGYVFLRSCSFSGNASTGSGGAVLVKGKVEFESCTFTNNTATAEGQGGGAIKIDSGSVRINRSYFKGNQAAKNGGAVWQATGVLYVHSSIFEENTATEGGALMMSGGEVVNCTIIKNQTFASSPTAAGLKGTGVITVKNTLLADNIFTKGTDQSSEYQGDSVTITTSIVEGEGGFTADALKTSYLAYATATFPYSPVNTALNAGSAHSFKDVEGTIIQAKSYYGRKRTMSGSPDVGAVEVGAEVYPDLTVLFAASGINRPYVVKPRARGNVFRPGEYVTIDVNASSGFYLADLKNGTGSGWSHANKTTNTTTLSTMVDEWIASGATGSVTLSPQYDAVPYNLKVKVEDRSGLSPTTVTKEATLIPDYNASAGVGAIGEMTGGATVDYSTAVTAAMKRLQSSGAVAPSKVVFTIPKKPGYDFRGVTVNGKLSTKGQLDGVATSGKYKDGNFSIILTIGADTIPAPGTFDVDVTIHVAEDYYEVSGRLETGKDVNTYGAVGLDGFGSYSTFSTPKNPTAALAALPAKGMSFRGWLLDPAKHPDQPDDWTPPAEWNLPAGWKWSDLLYDAAKGFDDNVDRAFTKLDPLTYYRNKKTTVFAQEMNATLPQALGGQVHLIALVDATQWKLVIHRQIEGQSSVLPENDPLYLGVGAVDYNSTAEHWKTYTQNGNKWGADAPVNLNVTPHPRWDLVKIIDPEHNLESNASDIALPGDTRQYARTISMIDDRAVTLIFRPRRMGFEHVIEFADESAIQATSSFDFDANATFDVRKMVGYEFQSWTLYQRDGVGNLKQLAAGTADGNNTGIDPGRVSLRINPKPDVPLQVAVNGMRDDYRLLTRFDRKVVRVHSNLSFEGAPNSTLQYGRVTPDVKYREFTFGDPLELRAVPERGFEFAGWTVTDPKNANAAVDPASYLVDGATLKVNNLAFDLNVTADFRWKPYSVNLGNKDKVNYVLSDAGGNVVNSVGLRLNDVVYLAATVKPDKGLSFTSSRENWILTQSDEEGRWGDALLDLQSDGRVKLTITGDFNATGIVTKDLSDKDGDGLTAYDERSFWGTFVNVADSDGDGLRDGWEAKYLIDKGLNPDKYATLEAWKAAYEDPGVQLRPNLPDSNVTGLAALDDDGDRLSNYEEGKLETNATDKDTDGDGFTDYYEVKVRNVDWNGSALLGGPNTPYQIRVSLASLVQGVETNATFGVLRQRNAATGLWEDRPDGRITATEGEKIVLRVEVANDFSFSNWSGTDSRSAKKINAKAGSAEILLTDNPLTLEIHENLDLVANFLPKDKFYVVSPRVVPGEFDGVLHGKVTLDPPGGYYVKDGNVTLRAWPDPGYEFSGWSGDFNGSINPLDLRGITRNYDLNATFLRKGTFVNVNVVYDRKLGSITGSGTYAQGETAVLTAVTTPGYKFSTWGGTLPAGVDKTLPVLSVLLGKDNVDLFAQFVPDDRDADGDGLSNYAEIITHDTNSTNPDTDGDRMDDKYELDRGLDPKRSDLALIDFIKADPEYFKVAGLGDGNYSVKHVPSGVYHALTVIVEGNGTVKGQGIYKSGTQVTLEANATAGWEFGWWDWRSAGIAYLLDNNAVGRLSFPLNKPLTIYANFVKAGSRPPDVVHVDTDSDGLSNLDEVTKYGTLPNSDDTDGDGKPDKMEIDAGSNALNDLVSLGDVKANPGGYGIPVAGSGERIYGEDVRRDIYRFIASKALSDDKDADLGWFYTAAHGWSWLTPSNEGFVWNSRVGTWVILNPHAPLRGRDPNVSTTFGKFVQWFQGEGAKEPVPVYGDYPWGTKDAETKKKLTLSVSPVGTGSVLPATLGYHETNATVPVAAIPATGYVFLRWEGDVATDKVDAPALNVSMDVHKALRAVFIEKDKAPKSNTGNVDDVDNFFKN